MPKMKEIQKVVQKLSREQESVAGGGIQTGTRLVLPPACWSTFWKSIFKHQLGCRFDILDSISSFFLYFDICNYICLDTSYHFLALSLLLKYSLLFQVLLY